MYVGTNLVRQHCEKSLKQSSFFMTDNLHIWHSDPQENAAPI